MTTVNIWGHGNTITHSVSTDVGSNGTDDPCYLVAWDVWRPRGAFLPAPQIGAADTAGFHLDKQAITRDEGIGNVP